MSIENIKRLKNKFHCRKKDNTTDKYFKLIDLVYYEEKEYEEDYDRENDIINFIFADDIIEMDMEDIRNAMLFILDLSNDIDEQLGYGFIDNSKEYQYFLQG